jgi:hypothetical protein
VGIKKIVSSLVVVALVLSGSSVYASPSEEANIPTKVSFNDSKDLYTVDGDFLGSVNRTTTIEQITDKEGNSSYIHTEINDYNLAEEYASIPTYSEKFADSTKSTTYSVTKDNQLVVNGEVISQTSVPEINLFAQDTGGVPSISHYYSTSDMTSYSFRTYSDIYFNFDHGVKISPTGNHIAKDGVKRTNLYFQDAKASMDAFDNSLRDFDLSAAMFAFEAAVTFFSLASIVGAIAAGGATAFAAVQAYNDWSDCKSNVSDAYTYVSMM